MKTYKFLFKPLFYIFNLVFATALVLYIEKLSPSQLGKFGTLFEQKNTKAIQIKLDQSELKKLFIDYKTGKIDSVQLNTMLIKAIENPSEN